MRAGNTFIHRLFLWVSLIGPLACLALAIWAFIIGIWLAGVFMALAGLTFGWEYLVTRRSLRRLDSMYESLEDLSRKKGE